MKYNERFDFKLLESIDKEVFSCIKAELLRQRFGLELIASENYVPLSIMLLQGSIFTNKYAEGYPNKRYYGGCGPTDQVEQLAIDRAKELFGAQYANVQPHSGSQANMAVYFAFLKPGDTILSMNLTEGGHLTHGSKVNFSGKLYNVVHYGVNEKGFIDYENVKNLALQYKPKLIVAGASAYSRIIDFEKFRQICDLVGAKLLVDMAHIAGLVAAGYHPSPVPFADAVTSTTHKTLRGPRGGFILAKSDYQKQINSAVFPGMQGGPLVHVIAAKALCFKLASTDEFKNYIKLVIDNAKALAQALSEFGFKLVSGGTDNHIILVDLTNKNITGKEAQIALEKAGITVNKNTIPNEKRSPFITSGIRLGTAAISTRGMQPDDMPQIASFISDAIKYKDDDVKLAKIKSAVLQMCGRYDIYEKILG